MSLRGGVAFLFPSLDSPVSPSSPVALGRHERGVVTPPTSAPPRGTGVEVERLPPPTDAKGSGPSSLGEECPVPPPQSSTEGPSHNLRPQLLPYRGRRASRGNLRASARSKLVRRVVSLPLAAALACEGRHGG